MQAHISMSPEFLNQFVFRRVIFNHVFARQLLKKIIAKHNIQKTRIHIFHNKLLSEASIVLDLVSNFYVVMRANDILTKCFL